MRFGAFIDRHPRLILAAAALAIALSTVGGGVLLGATIARAIEPVCMVAP